MCASESPCVPAPSAAHSTAAESAARRSAYRVILIVSGSVRVERRARGGQSLTHACGRGAAGLRLRRQRLFERERLVHIFSEECRQLLQLFEVEFVQLKPLRERVENYAARRLVRLAEGLAAPDEIV